MNIIFKCSCGNNITIKKENETEKILKVKCDKCDKESYINTKTTLEVKL